MGEYNNYNVAAVSEPEPTLQDASAAMDTADAQAQEDAGKPQTYTEERPAWLPEKFESAEAMATAYSELEGKIGAPKEETTEEAAEPAEDNATYDGAVANASAEWADNGALSEETYENLQKHGLNKAMVDSYIAGQQAIVAHQQTELTNAIGGDAEYQKMSTWASDFLSEEELDAYNLTVETGSVPQAKFAIKSLYSHYQSAGAPKLVQGTVNGVGVPPFGSRQQVVEAMRDSRYAKDPAYREEVQARLARSNV